MRDEAGTNARMEAAETLLEGWAVFDNNRFRPLYVVSEKWRVIRSELRRKRQDQMNDMATMRSVTVSG